MNFKIQGFFQAIFYHCYAVVKTQSSIELLNSILEKIFFKANCLKDQLCYDQVLFSSLLILSELSMAYFNLPALYSEPLNGTLR